MKENQILQDKDDVQQNNAQDKKTALVSIIGRPSSGKSTFLNIASGENISIVSKTPQTTRNAIKGIVNTSLGQLVFVDTPGIHLSDKKLNLRLQKTAKDSLESADCILYIIDATRAHGDEEKLISSIVKPFCTKTVIAINKTDLRSSNVKSAHDFITQNLSEINKENIIEISALKDIGIDDVLRALLKIAPVQPNFYPTEYYTDQEVAFRISEVIRGEAINRLDQEIPHALYVDIADIEMKNEGKKLWVRAFLCVERESQKGIVIGKDAQLIKTIRIESLKKLRKIFDYKIDLNLQVKVDKNWRQNDKVLNKLLNS